MAILDWPTGTAFEPREASMGASTPRSSFAAPFTGNTTSVGHLADRLRCTLTLPPCGPRDGQHREALMLHLASTGDWVRMGHPLRAVPLGTLRGLPTVQASAQPGARSVAIVTSAGATLASGDVVGVGGQLLVCGPAGATANAGGVMVVPLALPLMSAVAAGAAVVWQAPTGLWEVPGLGEVAAVYGRGMWQRELTLQLLQRPA